MKKSIILIIACLSMASCKKVYVCECKFDSGFGSQATTQTTFNDTKKNAQIYCDQLVITSANGTCYLVK